MLDFVPKVGKVGSGNLGKLGGSMWLRGTDHLVLWVVHNEKTNWQHFIYLTIDHLDTWKDQYWHSTW